MSDELSNMYTNMREDTEYSYSSSQDYAFPVLVVVVGVVACGGAIFCLIVVCCCCFKRTTKGRVLVPPPLLDPPAPPLSQIHIHSTYPGMSERGQSLYPEMSPLPQASVPVATTYNMGTTATITPEYPPSYDTDRLLQHNIKPNARVDLLS